MGQKATIYPIIGKHLSLIEIPTKGKTKKWEVWNHTKDEHLGEIAWDGGWRKYVFDDGYLKFDADCLFALGNFLKKEMEKRK